ncbi:hypothetical protein WME76_12135 [Sorangium sp. So ce119]|uniref:hypothetical protein n=1 Tax=Sorangium sp. So ce119 TaxID=3133279 RepID=UPI003F62C496
MSLLTVALSSLAIDATGLVTAANTTPQNRRHMSQSFERFSARVGDRRGDLPDREHERHDVVSHQDLAFRSRRVMSALAIETAAAQQTAETPGRQGSCLTNEREFVPS